jgi:hypothetical protein
MSTLFNDFLVRAECSDLYIIFPTNMKKANVTHYKVVQNSDP